MERVVGKKRKSTKNNKFGPLTSSSSSSSTTMKKKKEEKNLPFIIGERERQESLANVHECISGGSSSAAIAASAAPIVVVGVCEGKFFERSNFKYMAADDIYRYEFQDFTLFTNKFCDKFTDISIKEQISSSRWVYAVHLNCGLLPNEITPSSLNARVKGGTILAYKHLECRVNGNEGCYYGIVPVQSKVITNKMDSRCRFALQEIYPRKLYVEFSAAVDVAPCDKHPDCQMWHSRSHMSGNESNLTFCTKSIPWTKVHITMGEKDVEFNEVLREVRDCRVCAQCYRCNVGGDYCYRHKVCRHKQAVYHSGDTINIDNCVNVKTSRNKKK